MGHDRTVSFTLDTNLIMLKENPEGHPSCAIRGRWYRDPSLPIHRTEITRSEGTPSNPPWESLP
jgi:hypothetical protein